MKNTNMQLSKILTKEINAYNSIEPNVQMFVDQSAIFWVTKDGYYVWMSEHSGIDDFLDETHIEEDRRHTDKKTEVVGLSGVYWMNQDFQAPYRIRDFEERINQINVIV